jgi:hypothetical protein
MPPNSNEQHYAKLVAATNDAHAKYQALLLNSASPMGAVMTAYQHYADIAVQLQKFTTQLGPQTPLYAGGQLTFVPTSQSHQQFNLPHQNQGGQNPPPDQLAGAGLAQVAPDYELAFTSSAPMSPIQFDTLETQEDSMPIHPVKRKFDKWDLESRLDALKPYYPISVLTDSAALQAELRRNCQSPGEIFKLHPLTEATYDTIYNSLPSVKPGSHVIGLEIEAEHVSKTVFQHLPLGYLNVTKDGSIKDNGQEFLTPPSSAEAAARLLAYLYTMFELAPTAPKFTWRCSTHVHLNMRSLKIKHLLYFTILYSLFENEFFGFLEPSRRQSHFTVPLLDTTYYLNISKALFWQQVPYEMAVNWYKYSALNCRPLLINDHIGNSLDNGKGTVEFRAMEGLNSPHKLIEWINLIACLYDFCQEFQNHEQLLDFISGARSASAFRNIKRTVFGQYADILPDIPFAVLLQTALPFAKLCLTPPTTKTKLHTAKSGVQFMAQKRKGFQNTSLNTEGLLRAKIAKPNHLITAAEFASEEPY